MSLVALDGDSGGPAAPIPSLASLALSIYEGASALGFGRKDTRAALEALEAGAPSKDGVPAEGPESALQERSYDRDSWELDGS